VPGSWDVTLETLENSIRQAVGDAPFALVGYSIGGVIAHSLAARFEDTGGGSEGVVLIDTPTPAGDEAMRVFSMVMTEIIRRGPETISVDDDNWLVMGTYLRLIAEHRQARIAAPALMIRAGKSLDSADSAAPWPAWDVTTSQTEIPADHFALIEAAATEVAAATARWLEK